MTHVRTNWHKLARKLHRDERGGVSIETVLLICAVALPILIFIIKIGWPKIKALFDNGMSDLQSGGQNLQNGN